MASDRRPHFRRVAALLTATPVLAACEHQELQPAQPLARTIPIAVLLGLWTIGVPFLVAAALWIRSRRRVAADPDRHRSIWANRALTGLIVGPAAALHVVLAVSAVYDVAFNWREPKYAWGTYDDWVLLCTVGLTITGAAVVASLALAALVSSPSEHARVAGMVILGVLATLALVPAPPLAFLFGTAACILFVSDRRRAAHDAPVPGREGVDGPGRG